MSFDQIHDLTAIVFEYYKNDTRDVRTYVRGKEKRQNYGSIYVPGVYLVRT